MKKLSCCFLLTMGVLSLSAVSLMAAEGAGTDVNGEEDYYIEEPELKYYIQTGVDNDVHETVQAEFAVPTSMPGIDADWKANYRIEETPWDYYIQTGAEDGICESVEIVYAAAAVTPTPVPGEDANAQQDYFVGAAAEPSSKPAGALKSGAQLGKEIL